MRRRGFFAALLSPLLMRLGLKTPLATAEGRPEGIPGRIRPPTLSVVGNPADAILDLLRRSGWPDDGIDLGSFAEASAFCREAAISASCVVGSMPEAVDSLAGQAGLRLGFIPGGQITIFFTRLSPESAT